MLGASCLCPAAATSSPSTKLLALPSPRLPQLSMRRAARVTVANAAGGSYCLHAQSGCVMLGACSCMCAPFSPQVAGAVISERPGADGFMSVLLENKNATAFGIREHTGDVQQVRPVLVGGFVNT